MNENEKLDMAIKTTMEDIENIEEYIEEFKDLKEQREIVAEKQLEISQLILKILQEKKLAIAALEREGKEPCDKCCAEYGRYHKTNGYSLIKHNFCPECGRKLEG